MKVFFLSMIMGLSLFFSSSPSWAAASRTEKINLCSLESRNTIKGKYIQGQSVVLEGLTTWLSGENPEEDTYEYSLMARVRDASGTLYSWFFSTTGKFENESCHLIHEELSWSTQIREPEEDSSDDNSD